MFLFVYAGSPARAEVPVCEDAVSDSIVILDDTLDAIRPGLVALIPGLHPLVPGAFYATDTGSWYGVNLQQDVDPTCVLEDGTPVLIQDGPPLTGFGAAVLVDDQDVLAVGTHDEERDGWDHIGWEAIIAHEWIHLHQAAVRGSPTYSQKPLQRRFHTDHGFRGSVEQLGAVALAQHAACTDPAALVAAWDDMQGRLKPKHREASADWLFTEGVARYLEAAWENVRRGGGPDDLDAFRLPQCSSVDPEGSDAYRKVGIDPSDQYGYAMGCAVAMAFDTCLGPEWIDAAWATGFEPVIDRLR